MASRDRIARLILPALLLGAALSRPSAAQTRVSVAEASSRQPGDARPAHEGQRLTVAGIVAAKAIRIRDYSHLALEDEKGNGLTIESSDRGLDRWEPGDRLQLTGTVAMRAGLPVLHPEEVVRSGSVSPPAPIPVRLADLNTYRYLGVLVVLTADVVAPGENAGGEVLILGNSKQPTLRVFYPREQRHEPSDLARYRPGDRVRVVGVGSQYCPTAPYDRSFQLVIPNSNAVVLLERSWIVSPDWLLGILLAVVCALAVWWHRERVAARQRRGMRALMALAEDVVSAATPGEIAAAIAGQLPPAFGASDVGLYLHNQATNTLERVLPDVTASGAQSIQINSEVGGLAAAVALSFRNRAMLSVPDTHDSPLFRKDDPDLPAAAVFIPMLTHQETLGVLLVAFAQHRELTKDEQAAAQHVANQIATSLKLQEQKVMREQLARSERMAATGQLISSIAAELRVPLEAIQTWSGDLLSRPAPSSPGPELRGIALEADRASGILSRLSSFTSPESTQSQAVDVSALLRSVLESRKGNWPALGITGGFGDTEDEPLIVLGSLKHLEQVLLNLMMQAEAALEGKAERKIQVEAEKSGETVLVGMVFSDGGETASKDGAGGQRASSGALELQVWQAIVQAHGGEVKVAAAGLMSSKFEVRLPAYESDEKVARRRDRPLRPSRVLTALVVEPDLGVQRRLMTLLSARGHRSVPVPAAEDGLDISHRLRFDLVFCAVRLPKLNWVEFHQKVRRNIPAFVLLTDGVESAALPGHRPGEWYSIGRSLDEDELETVLLAIENRQEAVVRR